MFGVGSASRLAQYGYALENMRNPTEAMEETVDVIFDILVPTAAVVVGTNPVILAALGYWAIDTYYDGNLSKAIKDGRFLGDIKRSMYAIRELF